MLLTQYRKRQLKGTRKQYAVKTNDVLGEYERICSQLSEIQLVLEMASMEDGKNSSALLNTVVQAINQLILEHTEQANNYRKMI